ncbi:MAG: tRNA pseudouridine(13) synthase TruD [Pseudomonadota bacterium]
MGFEPSADGEHDFLLLEKTNTNTEWLARQLARFAGVASRDVGYSGLKDRHAVTRQWFSVHTGRHSPDWSALELEGVRVLDIGRHQRKLRRGSHRRNHFSIVLDGLSRVPSTAELVARIDAVGACGVPNYFGPQRFGRNGANLALAASLFAGKKLRRDKRGFAISAARAQIFNAILGRRVAAGSWDRILPGELANLDGSGSVFKVEAVDTTLAARARALDIHPTGTLWGVPSPSAATAEVAALESAVAEDFREFADGLLAGGVAAAARPLRVRPAGLRARLNGERQLCLAFSLPKGAFATALLAELAEVEDAAISA